jgi:MFS family permease
VFSKLGNNTYNLVVNNKALHTIFLFNGLFVLAGSLLGPLYAIYVEQVVGGIYSVTLSWATFLLSTTIFTMFLQRVGDRVTEKRYLLASGYLVRGICWILYIFTKDYYMLIAVQFLLGIGEAAGSPAFEAIFAEHLDKGKHIREYSEWKVISNITLAAGTLLGGFVVSEFGFTPLFIFMAGLAIISFIGIIIKPKKLL